MIDIRIGSGYRAMLNYIALKNKNIIISKEKLIK